MSNCHYCNNQLELVTGEVIYPHRQDLFHKKFWICKPCKAYVGCHPNSDRPLGTVATANLRKLRLKCHAMFDPVWKIEKKASRSKCYQWLKDQCNKEDAPDSLRYGRQIHFGSANEAECEFIIQILKEARHEQG